MSQHPLIQFFEYPHLTASMMLIARRFYVLAVDLQDALPDGSEKTVAMRKLLEARDAALRSSLQ